MSMPLKDDLILRSLEQLAEVVRALAGVTSTQAIEEAEATLARAYRQHTGSEATLFRQLPSEQLLSVLSSAGALDKEKAYLIASMFGVDARLQEAKGDAAPVSLQLKALDLHLAAANAELDVEDNDEQIERLMGELSAYVLPDATQWRLLDYAVTKGDYSGAEDQLFSLLERLGSTPTVQERGAAFYNHLNKISDAKLEAGGLPRAEVEEGSSAFEQSLESGSS